MYHTPRYHAGGRRHVSTVLERSENICDKYSPSRMRWNLAESSDRVQATLRAHLNETASDMADHPGGEIAATESCSEGAFQVRPFSMTTTLRQDGVERQLQWAREVHAEQETPPPHFGVFHFSTREIFLLRQCRKISNLEFTEIAFLRNL